MFGGLAENIGQVVCGKMIPLPRLSPPLRLADTNAVTPTHSNRGLKRSRFMWTSSMAESPTLPGSYQTGVGRANSARNGTSTI